MQSARSVIRERDELAFQVGSVRPRNAFDHSLMHGADHFTIACGCGKQRTHAKKHGLPVVLGRETLLAHDVDDERARIVTFRNTTAIRQELPSPRCARRARWSSGIRHEAPQRGPQRRGKTGIGAELCGCNDSPPPGWSSPAEWAGALAPDVAVRAQALEMTAHGVLMQPDSLDEFCCRGLCARLKFTQEPFPRRRMTASLGCAPSFDGPGSAFGVKLFHGFDYS